MSAPTNIAGRSRNPFVRFFTSPFVWLIAPAATFLVLMIAFPLGYVLFMSTQDYLIGLQGRPVGLQNYVDMLQDRVFWIGLRVTFSLYFMSLIAQLLIGLWVAMMLNRAFVGARGLRTILLSPLAMPPVAVGMMWLILLDPAFGPVEYFLELLGLPEMLFLASPAQVVPTLAAIDTWQYTPLIVIILLGGLQSLPEDPYQAAIIDGATAVQRFFRITLPLLRPAIVTAAVLRSIDLLRFFDTIYITTQGGPGNASTTLNIYAYKSGFVFFHMGYASALMIALFLIVLVIVLLLSRLRRMGQ
jgi:multiple sugar transport system permease protein